MNVSLLRLPYCETSVNDSREHESYPFVPLGLPMLTATLKTNGHKAFQDDLSARTFSANRSKRNINLSLFNNSRRVADFIRTGKDQAILIESEKIFKLAALRSPDICGISIDEGNNPSVIGVAAGISKLVKEQQDIPVIGGGRTASEVVERLLSEGIVDYWIAPCGNTPQELFLNFCDAYESRGFSPEKIPYLWHRERKNPKKGKGTIERQKEYDFIRPDFDGLPLELYRRGSDVEIAGKTHKDNILVLPYFFVRGCPNKCAFCSNSTLEECSTKGPALVAEDIRHLARRYETSYFYFLNTSINPTRDYCREVCTALEDAPDISFSDCANFRNMDTELLDSLKQAGAARLIYGIETGSERMLRYINKDVTIEKAESMLRKTYEAGIWGEIELIAGLPYETEEDLQQTRDFVARNSRYIREVNIFKFWLDGLFLRYPEKYGLSLAKTEGEGLCVPDNKRGFDETSGLSWVEKKKQIDASYDSLFAMREKAVHIDVSDFPADRAIFIKHLITQIFERKR